MAVYKRGYEPYEGRLTPERWRFLIIARYACRGVFDSRFLTAFFIVCAVWPLICAGIIYVPYNGAVAEWIGRHAWIPIDNAFFLRFMTWQGSLAYMLTGFLGPGLVAGDLVHNGLPLYFCRPFSRAEYVVGKMSVLAILTSFITWVPGLLLFAFKAFLEGPTWAVDNMRSAVGVFVGSWIWILALCFLALAMSAWVRWRIAAGALIFGIFFVAAGFGQAINATMNTDAGFVFNIATVIGTIWSVLLGLSARPMSVPLAWTALFGSYAVCYYLLVRKLKAYHVERS